MPGSEYSSSYDFGDNSDAFEQSIEDNSQDDVLDIIVLPDPGDKNEQPPPPPRGQWQQQQHGEGQ